MENHNIWRFAYSWSLVLHIVLVAGIGWYASQHPLQTEKLETYMELELASDSPPLGQPHSVAAQSIAVVQPISVMQQLMQSIPEPTKAQETQVVTEMAEAVSVEVQGGTVSAASLHTDNAAGTGVGSANGSSQGQGPGSGEEQSTVLPPRILKQVEPNFPATARRVGAEGTVVVKMAVLENGHPEDVRVLQSSGREDMDQAAVDAVERWRFIPAKHQKTGQSIGCVTSVAVVFRLR